MKVRDWPNWVVGSWVFIMLFSVTNCMLATFCNRKSTQNLEITYKDNFGKKLNTNSRTYTPEFIFVMNIHELACSLRKDTFYSNCYISKHADLCGIAWKCTCFVALRISWKKPWILMIQFLHSQVRQVLPGAPEHRKLLLSAPDRIVLDVCNFII